MEFSVALWGPEIPGNVGAVARVMKNFDFHNLLIIDPDCDPFCDESRSRAKHAQEVLDNAVVGGADIIKDFDLVVGTSAKLGGEYNLPRIPLTPEAFANSLSDGNVCLLFGRESSGLTNNELMSADILVSIPSNNEYPVLNLSHAVTVLLYELYKHDFSSRFQGANRRQRDLLIKLVNGLIDNMRFSSPDKAETQRVLWRRIFGSPELTSREAQSLIGFFKKL